MVRFEVYGEESGYLADFETKEEALDFIKQTKKFDKRNGIKDKYYIEVQEW